MRYSARTADSEFVRAARRCLLLILCATAATSIPAETLSGEAIALGGSGASYHWSVARCGATLQSEWRLGTGAVVAAEYLHTDPSGHVSYSYDRMNVDERAAVEISGGHAVIALSIGGRTRRREVSSTLPLLAGPMIITFVRERLERLRTGAPIDVAYLVPDRLVAIDLRLSLGPDNGRGVNVQIEPLSALVRLVVGDASVQFDTDGQMLRYVGRILPVRAAGASPREVRAELVTQSHGSACPRLEGPRAS